MATDAKMLDLIESMFTESTEACEDLYLDLVDEFADIHEKYTTSRLWEAKEKYRVYLNIERPRESLQLTAGVADGAAFYGAVKLVDGQAVASAQFCPTLEQALRDLRKPKPVAVPHNERATPAPAVKPKLAPKPHAPAKRLRKR